MIDQKEESFDLKKAILSYVRYWPWFLLCILIAFFSAHAYLRYTTYFYKSKTTILIKDENNSSVSELANLGDLGLGNSGLSKSAFENEIEILKSKRIISQVVEDLGLQIRYFKEGNIKSSEIFDASPFRVKLLFKSDSLDNLNRSLFISPMSNTQFTLRESRDGEPKTYDFGKPIDLKFGRILVVPQFDTFKTGSRETILVNIIDKDRAVNGLLGSLNVASVNKNSSIIELSYVSSATDKSESILNSLVDAYNEDAINDRNLVSKNTANFIDSRLRIITEELDSVETTNVNFKEQNRITDLTAEGQLSLENASETEKRQLLLNTQIERVQSVSNYLTNETSEEVLPVNLGISDNSISSSIIEYNTLVLEKKRFLQSATIDNPVVTTLSDQITQLRSVINESLKRVERSLLIESRDLKNQRGKISGEISRLPSMAKASRDILRQQNIKEQLYLILLEKREETAISLAVTAPKAKIVDRAYSLKSPVSPNRKVIYLGAVILGFLIPFVIIYGKQLLDTKIHNRTDVEKEVPGLPILGEVPTVDSKESETITTNDRSVLAEAFRILRTNLGYFLKSTDGGLGNTIFVTSTIKGEGKTFVAYNLALSLMSTGKKVLLVGADIRNPQLHRYIDKNEFTIGLAEYLYDDEVEVATITNDVYDDKEHFDLILSGRIPPNPAELLMNGRFDQLLDEVRDSYDYVIVDTAPTLLVTDTLLISQKADMTVYVSRAEYTDKKLLQYPKELYQDGKLKNIAFAINGIKITNFGYGSKYGYGYGYGQDKPSFAKRLKSRLGLN